MLIKSPKTLDLSRRRLLTGGAALAAMAQLSRRANAQSCPAYMPTAPAEGIAAGYTQYTWGDDFNVAGTVNPVVNDNSPNFNWWLQPGNGASIANVTVDTTAKVSNQWASPQGGVLSLKGPNWPNNGNVTISSTPASTQGKSVPPYGAYPEGCWDFLLQMSNVNCTDNSQWYAWWFDTQVNGPAPGMDELDGGENYCNNYGYASTVMTSGSHEWTSAGQTASGGGTYGTLVNGTWKQTLMDSGWHRGTLILKQLTSNTGYVEIFWDGVPQVLYGHPSSRIPTGAGGATGYQWLSLGGQPIYIKLGGPPSSNYNFDYARYFGKAA